MILILSPIASNYTTKVIIEGLKIYLDDESFDLSVIPEGGQAEASDESPFIGIVTRDEVTIKYHYDSSKAESVQSMNWQDFTFNLQSGECPCPIIWKPDPVEVIE